MSAPDPFTDPVVEAQVVAILRKGWKRAQAAQRDDKPDDRG